MGDWRNYLTFDGRLSRKQYWLMTLIMFGVGIVAFLVVAMLGGLLPLLWILGVPPFLLFLWVATSIAARRLHDRGKSAWWLLLYQLFPSILDLIRSLATSRSGPSGPWDLLGFIAFGISMWVLVDLGTMKGRAGANRYGDDPLGPPIQEVFA
jgi:uncharacterized membrane protein YhaH (DUF805 family)